jgi:tight adherence protein B
MVLPVLLFFVATFGMVSAGVIGYRFLLERRALLGEEAHSAESGYEWVEPAELLKNDSLSTISFWDRLLTRVDYVKIMKVRLAESGLSWSVGRLTALMLLLGAIVLAVLVRLSWAGALLSVIGACLVSMVPYLYVLRIRRKRMEKFESQFADALDSLARALRAGHPLAAGMQMLVYEAPQPLSGEMRITAEERKLGRSWEQALDNLAVRVPLVEVSIFVAAVKLQNRAGGKLSEVLGRLSETMREAYALKSEVRSIAAHGKMTGRLLTVLPLLIAVMMAVVNPHYLAILWTHPIGKDLIAAAVLSLILAHLVISKLVDIKI